MCSKGLQRGVIFLVNCRWSPFQRQLLLVILETVCEGDADGPFDVRIIPKSIMWLNLILTKLSFPGANRHDFENIGDPVVIM